MRLPARTRSVAALLAIPCLLLRKTASSGRGAVSECADDVHPVELVQRNWNLTARAPLSAQSAGAAAGHGPLDLDAPPSRSRLRGPRLSLSSLSFWKTGGLPSLGDKQRGALAAGAAFGAVVLALLLLACVLQAASAERAAPEEAERAAPEEEERAEAATASCAEVKDGAKETPEELMEVKDVDLHKDIYSTALQGLLRDGVAVLSGRPRSSDSMAIHRFRLWSVVVLLLANYALQFGVLYFLYVFMILPSVADVQATYRDFRAACFAPSGEFRAGECQDFGRLGDVCELVFTYTWFMCVVLMIWSMAMVREFRSSERLCRTLWGIESTTHFDAMIEFSGDSEHVTHLTPEIRVLIFLGVMVPQICISLVLGILGTVWLASTDDLTDVILNAVALEFIIQIDELLFDAVVPIPVSKEMSKFKLTLRRKVKAVKLEFYQGFLASLAYMLTAVLLPLVYMSVGQKLPWVSVFPGYERSEVHRVCIPYLSSHGTIKCLIGNHFCFS